jgi:mannose-6-phosphate isomerase-like protein (cupin superfamily)
MVTEVPRMEHETLFPSWRELVRYSTPGPQPTILYDAPGFRVLVAGLEAGGRIPSHPERQAVYHFLEGEGAMLVDDQRYPVTVGVTVIAPAGSSRGIEASTRLAFLAVRVGPEPAS